MTARKKAIIVSLEKTNLSSVVMAKAGLTEYDHIFSSGEVCLTAKHLINEHIIQLGKQQGREIVADTAGMKSCLDNLSYHFMQFCGDSEHHETAIFEGFNDQNGKAIRIRVKVTRTEVMSFPAYDKN